MIYYFNTYYVKTGIVSLHIYSVCLRQLVIHLNIRFNVINDLIDNFKYFKKLGYYNTPLLMNKYVIPIMIKVDHVIILSVIRNSNV